MEKNVFSSIMSSFSFASEFLDDLAVKAVSPLIPALAVSPSIMAECSTCYGGCAGDCEGNCFGCSGSCDGFNK